MKRRTRLIAAAAIAAALVLVAVAAAGGAWYRVQVARGEAAEQFFGDLGEETRMTSFQQGSPSEMSPLESARSPAPPAGH